MPLSKNGMHAKKVQVGPVKINRRSMRDARQPVIRSKSIALMMNQEPVQTTFQPGDVHPLFSKKVALNHHTVMIGEASVSHTGTGMGSSKPELTTWNCEPTKSCVFSVFRFSLYHHGYTTHATPAMRLDCDAMTMLMTTAIAFLDSRQRDVQA